MGVPEQVARLIEGFDSNIEAYKDHKYNETQLRHEFVDPFFMALGWDVNNTAGLAEAYKDVIHEDSIRIGSATKAPDYCFRIGGTRKFFVETKRPSVNIRQDVSPAFQLRRYAWSAKLPLSILTDFEEFAVYDCRVRPVKADLASAARVKYMKYTEYADRWDEIASVFSKEAILKGSFDKYAESARRKKGTAEVDVAFLAEIEKWRDIIARNIALRNPSLTNRQLNFAVQRTIDRIIFLRIAEDRGIERYGELLAATSGADTYKRLFRLFEKADDRYNSGLFHFHKEPDRDEPDDLTPVLTIDDKPLKDIIKSLYYPDSPYEFAVLPAEILGQIYEQFLGKVITLTKGHHARIEYKPEVKKAGGVYYTPAYIVDYIVKNTVGKLLEKKTPLAVNKIKILDPACGSGSFLIAAYQYLLDWHLKYYTENEPDKYTKGRNPRLYQTDKGEYRLTISERKRILLNNIFGVDIDSQAVEVTKLSLLLKVLEGEAQLVLFHKERALPDLGNNIKCGNSLIGPD
ncbi:MAG: restriction endonuclease subunit M, partial [Planctomycetota bacterium]